MKNILNSPERETAGVDTQLRFNYQTDWAISYLLKRVLRNEDFVIFMEYHEDVIFSNSSELTDDIEFEFYQLKTSQSNFTLESICKFDTHSKKNSPLGKMILGVENKIFKKYVKKLCLLSISNINFSEKIDIMGHFKFLKDLKDDEISKIMNYLEVELKEIDIAYKDIICFEKADLPFQNSESTTKGKISQFIEEKYGSIMSNVSSIYTALWDDLRIKHDFLLSFDEWSDCVEKRGLKSSDVTSILSKNIDLQVESGLKSFIEKFLEKYDDNDIFTPIKLNLINEYHIHIITNRSSNIFRDVNSLRMALPEPIDIYDTDTYTEAINTLNNMVDSAPSLKVFNKFKAVSTYEILRDVYEKLNKR